ncbi:glycosyl transferase family 90 [Mucilaginibacter sp. PAMB04168]|uniref:glycosyl transferase family 90 n=1 Tax=Mucilaginibacter sp. PAMB04168 TaxID=3138567 RepID=UPI0031F64CF3
MALERIGRALRKNKLPYYALNLLRQLLPRALHQKRLHHKLQSIKHYNKAEVLDRVNYYNKLTENTALGAEAVVLKDMPVFKSPKAYGFDTFEYTRYFKETLKACFLFGDVIHVPEVPTLQKSRPINGNNANAILLKLDKKRHFVFVKDGKPFNAKKDMLIGRSAVNQPHRVKFMEMYFGNTLCNLGQVNTNGGRAEWIKPKLSISAHLNYKFILSLEGYDVATNLKWIMSSNSIAVMPKPTYETWFMEGRLMPNVHYIEIKADYSDLEDRLKYYIAHPHEAEAIVKNANVYVKQFQNKQKEDLISLMVLQKYFDCTRQ